MLLRFDGIEAETPQLAAQEASERSLKVADDLDECDGETFAAMVDVAGDEDFSQSVTIDFEPEQLRRAASGMQAALTLAQHALNTAPRFLVGDTDSYAIAAAVDRAIAKTKAATIPSAPPATADTPPRFDFTHELDENPDRAWVLVDGKYDVSLKRTGEGIVIDIYPKDWIDPIDTMTVWDDEVAELVCDPAEATEAV